jgi:type IV pilus biogenesis protein CpaD/CtpE
MVMSSRLLLLPAALALLAGCDTIDPVSGSVDPGFGEAFKYDMAVQTINPEPVYGPEAAQPGDSGAKAAAAVKRYRTDTVKAVETQTTTESTSSGGSGSGGGGPQ